MPRRSYRTSVSAYRDSAPLYNSEKEGNLRLDNDNIDFEHVNGRKRVIRPCMLGISFGQLSRHVYHWSLAFLAIFAFGWCLLGVTLLCYGTFDGLWASKPGRGPIEAFGTGPNSWKAAHSTACCTRNNVLSQASRPLLDDLSRICGAVEADVWLDDGQRVLVGPTEASLDVNRTLSSLYIEPMVQALELRHGRHHALKRPPTPNADLVEPDYPQTFVMIIDFKSDGVALWNHVDAALEPLRRRGYLTQFDGLDVVEGEVTVVVSGDAPFAKVIEQREQRDIFFDAPLELMSPTGPAVFQPLPTQRLATSNAESLSVRPAGLGTFRRSDTPVNAAVYSAANSYYASASFERTIGRISDSGPTQSQLALIRAQVRGAHARGLQVRYWDVPTWPLGIFSDICRTLLQEGVDVVNAEHSEAAATIT
ncbi:uncharacterized protein HMPREF1541_08817 [Cyphellophora europaea CBS 101466]|uniref:Altered inheritance of mitochondria protein 6 n=1 Tax=Cyphellophora europaea (strain CBS 101466) TaxID=1220924 RepID=W2RLD4_CYPE1|nr:uncharacterized protein HMPREF1541_08817 [Cyphellophora europaea CBS 101466]ETN36539.1 hypothetical protein HMPREF1541_08817 [Cyphellophora europaea CBS 101466]